MNFPGDSAEIVNQGKDKVVFFIFKKKRSPKKGIRGTQFIGNFVLGCISLALQVGCTTTEKRTQQQDLESLNRTRASGQWEAKALFRDKLKNERNTATLDLQAVWPDRLRMEVSGPLGVQVASITQKKDWTQAILFFEKRYVEGKLKPEVSRALFKVEISPLWFLVFAFDRPMSGPDWKCQMTEDKKPLLCEREKDQLRVEWVDRLGDKRKVLVDHPDYQVQIAFIKSQTMVQLAEEIFTLSAPEGYGRYRFK